MYQVSVSASFAETIVNSFAWLKISSSICIVFSLAVIAASEIENTMIR